jgi:basic membrane lipoprotein Med (substrate-binding protein (PBP1-ABC) superfamily)/DNA-binding SARP family transcriptional activator
LPPTCLGSRGLTADGHLELRLLGPVEVLAGGRPLALGGGKQRAVLAALALRAGRLVPVDLLVEELWGEAPPPSAAHTIEGYVSRLRRALEPHGATIARRGEGYVVQLGGASVDAHEADRLASAAATALAHQRPDEAARLADEALALWRGPVLADVPLHGPGRTDGDRLEELRLRVLETWAEAGLALGRPEHVASELRPVVETHPYRERFVAQLMLALYRSGRQTEALDAYERLRRTLDEELGLLPSQELQRLSGAIVRQDGRLLADPAHEKPQPIPPRRRSRRLLVPAVLAVATAIAVSVALVATAGRNPAGDASIRIALVVPRDPAAEPSDAVLSSIADGLHRAEREYGVTTEIFVADEYDPEAPSVQRMLAGLRSGSFDLALVFGGLQDPMTKAAPTMPSTRFAFFDLGPELPNATTLVFDDGEAGYLAGYLSGLVEGSRGPRLNEQHVVSTIGGLRGVPSVEELLAGFARGARDALPDVKVLTAYAQEFVDTSPCEAVADRHIDAGADIVFAAAGRCSLGALSATAIRRVWGVGVDADQSYLGDHVLVSTVKRYDQAVFHVVRSFVQGTLQPGTVRLGLGDDAVGIVGIGPGVAEPIRRKVARVALEMRSSEGS